MLSPASPVLVNSSLYTWLQKSFSIDYRTLFISSWQIPQWNRKSFSLLSLRGDFYHKPVTKYNPCKCNQLCSARRISTNARSWIHEWSGRTRSQAQKWTWNYMNFSFQRKKKRQKSKYEVTSQTHHHWARDVSTRSLSSRNIAIVFDSRAV